MNHRAPEDIIIAPSVIAADWWCIADQIREVEAAGCQWLHFDAMDGHFAPNITLGPMFLQALRSHCKLHFDTHLMIRHPDAYLDEFAAAGANSISVHVEDQLHLHRLIAHIKSLNIMAGAVLNPATPINTLDVILPDLDYVLMMSVNPGFSGQKFLPLVIEKIVELDRIRRERNLDFLIQVDGGMAPATAPLIMHAGADVLVCGSSVFNSHSSIGDNVRAIREALRTF